MKYTLLTICTLAFLFDCNGKIELEEHGNLSYIKGSDELYTGKYEEFYENGQKFYEGFYREGKKEGKWIWWYNTGELRWERNFKDGKLDGKIIGWEKNGKKKYERLYKEGKLIE